MILHSHIFEKKIFYIKNNWQVKQLIRFILIYIQYYIYIEKKFANIKYYIIYFIKKKKYVNYKNLLLKYINNSKHIFFKIHLRYTFDFLNSS